MDIQEDATKILRDKIKELKKEHKFEEALLLESQIEDFSKKSKPEDYWIKRGMYLRQMGKYEEALKCFDKNLVINSNSYDSLFEKGKTLYAMRRYNEAIECFFKAYENEYSNLQKHSTLTENLKSHKKLENVLAATLDDSMKLRGHDLWHYLAATLTRLRRYEEAIENFNYAAKTNPHDSETFYEWAKCELLLNKPKKCLELLRKACDINSETAKLLRIDPDFEIIRDDEQFRTLCQSDKTIP
ncbi:MAG: tetratricopeptide repeat protein [Thermoproteota archaeon]